jgi:hypothetical protein
MANTEFPNCQLHGLIPVLPDVTNVYAEDWEVDRLKMLGFDGFWNTSFSPSIDYPEDERPFSVELGQTSKHDNDTRLGDPTVTLPDDDRPTGTVDHTSQSSFAPEPSFSTFAYPVYDDEGVPEKILKAVVPKVYDVFLFNNELEMLEVRLNELTNVVDKFVIVDSVWDHQLRPKKSLITPELLKSDPRFSKFADKIEHISLETLEGEDGWGRERYTRIQTYEQACQRLKMLPGDLVILGDLDELPRGSVINRLKRCKGWDHRMTLRTFHFYYSYEIRADFDWFYPSVIRHFPPEDPRHLEANLVNESVDRSAGGRSIMNAGWHCSWCFGTIDGFLGKITTYAVRLLLVWSAVVFGKANVFNSSTQSTTASTIATRITSFPRFFTAATSPIEL